MSNKQVEELCALMDGELQRSEARFVLKSLGHDRQLVSRWKRYHFSRAVLRGDDLGNWVCLSDRISVAIAREPTPTRDHARASGIMPAWLRPVAGFAVAASVAIAAFTLVQNERVNPVVDHTVTDVSLTGSALVPTMAVRAQPVSMYNRRLQDLVMRHKLVASPRRGRDLAPFVYMVTTPIRDPALDSIAKAESMKNSNTQAANGGIQ